MNNILKNTDSVQARLACFARFIEERELVRQRKDEGKPRPWTKDELLQTYHFCNVCRADDRVTIWIGKWAQNWAPKERWFAYAVARWFNEPETLKLLPCTFDRDRYKAILKLMINNGQKVFRASYIINGFPNMPKYISVVDKVLQPLWHTGKDDVLNKFSMQDSHANLMALPGMGSFMAGQIVADWQTFGEIRGTDKYIWAPIGPGSARGLQWVYGLPKPPKQDKAVELMQEAYDYLKARNRELVDRLILHDIQNCFCEMSKYVRGYSKTKYKPFAESFF